MDDLARFLPLFVVVTGVLLAIGWRSLRQRRQHGTSGIVLRSQVARAFPGWIILILAVDLTQAAMLAFAPGWLPAVSLPLALPGAAVWAGAFLCLAFMSLLLLAQGQMGASWRMGVDASARPGLVTNGLFGVCRNPIYTLAIFWLMSFCLMVPTWVSVVAFCWATVSLRRLVAREEAYLLQTYGDEYRAYMARVGRFLPWSSGS